MAKRDIVRQPAGELSIEQHNAIDLLIQGKSDRETAEAVGVVRQTVTGWRLSNAAFICELNKRRADVWGAQTERLRAMVGEALGVLADDLRQEDDRRLRQAAAVHVLRAVGMWGVGAPPVDFSEQRINLELLMRSV